MKRHIHVELSTAERMANSNRIEQNRIKAVTGYRTVAELKTDLAEMRSKGMEAIPSENCNNNLKGRCQGHESQPAPPHHISKEMEE